MTGEKTWEIRGSNTSRRGTIALIRGGSGLIVGTCRLTDVVGPFASAGELEEHEGKHRVPPSRMRDVSYKKPYAWVLADARPLAKPIPYKHPSGAVIWVDLSAHPRLQELRALT